MAKVGFSPLGLGAGVGGRTASSGEGIGLAAGTTVGWVGGIDEGTGTDSSIRLFFLIPQQRGWQGGMPGKVWLPSSESIPHEGADFC